MNNCAVILAGGEGTRMKSDKPKVMAELLFRPMLSWVIDAAREAGIDDVLVVTGYKAEVIEEYLGESCETAVQTQRLGTAHAVMQATDFIKRHSGKNVLILNGDAPLMDSQTIINALKCHEENSFVQTVISAKIDNPYGYGRIVRDSSGNFTAIIEEASATEDIRKINEINSGAMWFSCDTLCEVLTKITNNNSKGEYYLTDTVEILLKEGKRVGAYTTDNPDTVLGANSRVQLYELNEMVRQKILKELMLGGVSVPCTDGVIIDKSAEIGRDTVILPGTIIKEGCKIGSGCEIGPFSVLQSTVIGDNTVFNSSQAYSSVIGSFCKIGPFSHLRPDTVIKDSVRIGNFVEIKGSDIGSDSKISHLTYVGDSDVGEGVNFGCGAVTVNFDGRTKNRCVIEDGAFIGCNTNLVAPVKIGKRAYTAAGSTVTEDVPANALAIARKRQINKENWVTRKKPYREK